jgi:hypothetical protein
MWWDVSGFFGLKDTLMAQSLDTKLALWRRVFINALA